MDSLDVYYNQILKPALAEYGVSTQFAEKSVEVIDRQIRSILRHWKDIEFRRTLLLLGKEEASFYLPKSKLDIRCFVVLAIRDSPLEAIQSNSYQAAGLTRSLGSREITRITSDAIRYFSGLDFDQLCSQICIEEADDLYWNEFQKHPVCFAALRNIASSSAKAKDYLSIPTKENFVLPGLSSISVTQCNDSCTIDTYDGYSQELPPALINHLLHFETSDCSIFVSDSFKAVTRNFARLLDILEFLLTRGHAFVTTNYYIENGHVEQRSSLLRPAHTSSEMFRSMQDLSGLGYKHRTTLKSIIQDNF